jgi:hypothetical protein
MSAEGEPRPGLYRHYKGNLYEVLGVATHSESGERLVVYRPCYAERGLWVRPLAMFLEQVSTAEGPVARFAPQPG